MLSNSASLLIRMATVLLTVVLGGCGATWKAPLESRDGGAKPSRHAPHQANAPARLSGSTYRVQPGDTLFSIAWRAGHNLDSLARWNNLKPPYTIYPGQRLRLVPAAARRAHVKPAPAPQPPARTNQHTERQPAARPNPAVASTARPGWDWPVKGNLVSSYSASDSTRQGIKLGGTAGQPVLAAAAGRVVYSGSGLIGYGRLIIIKHNEHYLSAYGHNAKLLVKEGEQVQKGKRIADMGRSNDGRAMLHFEIRRDGRPIDPLTVLPKR